MAAYNAANEITSRNGSATGWTSDAAGNQTSGTWGTATYDDRGAVTTVTPAGSSSVTSMGNYGTGNSGRLSTGSTATVNGALGLIGTLPTSDLTNANNTGIAYRYTPSGALLSAALPDGTTRYYLTDIQGSVVAVTGASSTTATYSYDPYGTTRATSGSEATSNPFRYTSAYTDSTGLYHNSARYYDPTTGRFTQQDPSGQETNPYAYTADNPINYVDPSGELSKAICIAAGLGVGAAAVAVTGGIAGIGVAALAAAEATAAAASTAGTATVLASFATGGSVLGFAGSIFGASVACD